MIEDNNEHKLITAENAANIINAALRRYELDTPRPDARPQDRVYIAWYRAGLLYLGEHIKALNITKISELDMLFRQVYVPHAIRAGVMPNIGDFSLFAGINADMLITMGNKPGTEAYNIYQSWIELLRQFVISNLSIEPGSNINLIFIAKACYGIHEEKNTDINTQKSTVKKSREQIISELGGENVENSENVENL